MKGFEPIHVVSGPCVVLNRDDVDTDQIIPARFLSRTRQEGFAGLLFLDFLAQGQEPHNQSARAQMHQMSGRPKVLLAAENFGCGSSREHAVWALLDNGFKAVIAKSFGDIFYANAINNGLLLAQVNDGWSDLLSEVSHLSDLTVDLDRQKIETESNRSYEFEMDEFFKNMLLKGAQEIDMTLSLSDKIEAFEHRYAKVNPWLQHPEVNISNKESSK